jgi:hypothetical protein
MFVQSSSGPEWISFPRPVTAIGNGLLAKLSLQAAGRPTNKNAVESRWSILATKVHSNVCKASARYKSDISKGRSSKFQSTSAHGVRGIQGHVQTERAEISCAKTSPCTERSFVIITMRANKSFMRRSRTGITMMTLESEILPTKKTREKSSLKTRNQKGKGGVGRSGTKKQKATVPPSPTRPSLKLLIPTRVFLDVSVPL